MRARRDTTNVAELLLWTDLTYPGADKSLARPRRKQARKDVRDARDLNNTETRVVIKFFFPLQGRAPKEIHAILKETLACFLPGRAKDLSAPLYNSARGTATDLLRPLQYAVLEITNHIPYIGSPRRGNTREMPLLVNNTRLPTKPSFST